MITDVHTDHHPSPGAPRTAMFDRDRGLYFDHGTCACGRKIRRPILAPQLGSNCRTSPGRWTLDTDGQPVIWPPRHEGQCARLNSALTVLSIHYGVTAKVELSICHCCDHITGPYFAAHHDEGRWVGDTLFGDTGKALHSLSFRHTRDDLTVGRNGQKVLQAHGFTTAWDGTRHQTVTCYLI